MAALDFPNAPTNGQKYPQPPVVGQPVYTWDGEKWGTGQSPVQAIGNPSNTPPLMDGNAEIGTALEYARSDHRHPIDVSRAPVYNASLTGTPRSQTTPPIGSNDDSLATTAFVTSAVVTAGSALPSNSTPLMDGAPSAGTSVLFARDDHRHPVDTSRAPLASPIFTGVPEVPTATAGTNTTQIASTAFVKNELLVVGAVVPATATPLIEGTAAVGTSVKYAREDHVHPALTPPSPATVAPVMDGTAAVGTTTKYAREDHVHPSDTSKATTTYVDTGLAGKAPISHSHLATDIQNLSEAIDDRAAQLLVAGTNITLNYDDLASTLTITSTASGGAGTGDVVGPTSSVADRIAVFNGTTGKIIKDGGVLVAGLQPIDAELTAIAGLASAADRVPYFTGTGTAAITPLTTFGRSLIDDADATAAKTTLGIAGSALTLTNDTNVTLTAGGSAATALLASSSVTAGWAGTLSTARGGLGTNASSSSGVVQFSSGTASFTGTNGTGNVVLTDSATLTGTPSAPTPAAGTNTTRLATTAFVTGGFLPVTGGTISSGGVIITAGNLALNSGYIQITGPTGNWSEFIVGGTGAGSHGLSIAAGNSGGDVSLQVNNRANTIAGLVTYGDGRTVFGGSGSGGVTFSSSLTANASVALNSSCSITGNCGVSGQLSSANYVGTGTNRWQADGVVWCTSKGYQPGGGVWGDTSDARIKTVSGPYEYGLAQIKQINPVRYTFNGNDGTAIKTTGPDGKETTEIVSAHSDVAGKEFIGVIAQEIETVLPETVTKHSAYIDGQPVTDLRIYDSSSLIYALVNAVKELSARVEQLEAAP